MVYAYTALFETYSFGQNIQGLTLNMTPLSL